MKDEKILLMLLPFWDPQIPPPGLSCLKGFLQSHGYRVKAVDANVEGHLKETYHLYFTYLRQQVKADQQGNFDKIGFDIFHNHLMAFLHQQEENPYYEALQILVQTTFFMDFEPAQLRQLNGFVETFFQRLQVYLEGILDREKPDVLGITVYTDTLPASLLAFKLAKAKNPALRTVMGGGIFASDLALDTPNMAALLAITPYIDKFLVGEGEILFLKYLQGLLPVDQRVVGLKDIGNELLDMARAPLPDFSDFDLVHYPYLATYSSRSCPFQCEFCTETQIWGRYRKKSAGQVVDDLMALYQRYGFQLFFMSDSLLNPIINDLSQCLEGQATSIYYDGYLRADPFAADRDRTMMWRRSGFYRARLGLESGSQKVLDLMNKRITVDQIKASIAGLAYAGIKTTTYWLLGFPGETEEDFLATLDLIEEMADDIYEVNCSPFWYFVSAQGGDSVWRQKQMPLYPEKVRELCVLQTWVLDLEPHRQETYRRMWRFTEHCKKLGIPSPHSLQEFHQADLRWAKLQKNAVPPMVWFGDKDHYICENKKIQKLDSAKTQPVDDGDFGF